MFVEQPLDLEQLEKRTRGVEEAVGAGSVGVALRVLRATPDVAPSARALLAAGIAPAQARLVVAREAGFASWDRLRQTLDIAAVAASDAERVLVDAALAGDEDRVEAMLQRYPDLRARSIPCALVLAEPPQLGSDVNRELPPKGWPPLLYLCSSRYRNGDENTRAARLEIARRLIDLGAVVNVGMREAETIRGYRTALGAAVGRARQPALVELLLRAGADIDDGPTLYEGCAMWEAVRVRDVKSLELLLAAEPPQWHVCHALPQALRHDDLSLVRLLLQHGGDPNWTMGAWGFKGNCLHEAVVLGNDPAIVQALLEHGARTSFQDRDGRTPLALATCLHRDEIAALLRDHGADDTQVRAADRWAAACFKGDAEAARAQPAPSFVPADHLWLCRAIARRGSKGESREGAPPALCDNAAPVVELLLAGGLDPNVADDDGERPLHLAAAADDAATLNVLLAAGADARALNFAGQTPLDVALTNGHYALAEQLAEHDVAITPLPDPRFDDAFERAADAVVEGDIESLRQALRERPELATARSSRPHRCTLLNYLGANGFEDWRQQTPANATEVIDLLIESGSDPNAVCYTYRGGPGENTLGLLASSGHPREAGLTLAMASALGRGGAKLDAVYAMLAALFQAHQQGRLAEAVRAVDVREAPAEGVVLESAALGEATILFALLDAGANINARRGDGATALHLAAFGGNAALVDKLLARGADATLRDHVFDGTPAGWAFAGGHEELGKALATRLGD